MRMFRVVVNGSEYQVEIEELREDGSPKPESPAAPASPAPKPAAAPAQAKPQQQAAAPAQPATSGGDGVDNIAAPMPGTVLSVAVGNGDSVSKGQTLLVLEAMKMENEIKAPSDGVVSSLNVTQGASVNAGDILVVLSS